MIINNITNSTNQYRYNTNFAGHAIIYDGANILDFSQKMHLRYLAKKFLPKGHVVCIGTQNLKTHDAVTNDIFNQYNMKVATTGGIRYVSDISEDVQLLNPRFSELSRHKQKKLRKKYVYEYLTDLIKNLLPGDTTGSAIYQLSELKRDIKQFARYKKSYSPYKQQWNEIKSYFRRSKPVKNHISETPESRDRRRIEWLQNSVLGHLFDIFIIDGERPLL